MGALACGGLGLGLKVGGAEPNDEGGFGLVDIGASIE